ncbi:MAG: TonB-dependent receptor [Caulobacteraceae bacterium]|nr:TonB-dependent receptor [Caulobacteraceae bacterium]
MKSMLLASACALALTEAAHAQTTRANAGANQVDEVVVTASRTAERLREVPASVSVVPAAQIKDTPAQGLNDTLRLVPGMNLTMIGPDVGHPTAYNEGMRGLPTTETRFLVLMDGVPVNDPFFGYIQWNRIPLDNIDRVEIVRGGGSPLWGNTAMGGVVNVITRAPASTELDVDAAGGSYGSYRASAYGAYRVSDQFALSLNTAFSGTAGYQTTPASWTSYGSTTLRSPVYTPTSFNARNVGLRADFEPTSDLTGFLVVNYHSNDQVLSTPIGLDSQQTWTYSGQLKKTFGNGGALTVTAFHDDSHFVTNNPHLLSFTTEYNSNVHTTPVNDTGGSLTWSQDLPSILKSYSLGVDVHAISGEDDAQYYLPSGALAAPTIVGGGKQLFVGGFAEVRLEPVKRLEVVGSVRYQYYRNYDGVDTFPPAIGAIPASSKTSTDPRVNVRYALTDSFALRGAYYQSFRAPTLDQLYRTYADTTAGIYEGNPFLKPETLEGGEVGLDFNRPGFRSQLTFYSTTITNLITQRNLVPSEYPTTLGVVCGYDPATFAYLTCTRNINAASALARGMEFEADWTIGHGVTAGLAYTYTDSRYTSNPEDPTAVGERLEGVPMHNVSGHVAYQAPAGWRIATDLRWVSKSYGDAHPDDGLIQNAHFVMDVSGSYPLTHYLQVYVQIQNLTNSRYIAQNGGGAPILGTPFEVMSGFRLTLR